MRVGFLLRGRVGHAALVWAICCAAGCGGSLEPANPAASTVIRLEAVTPTSVTGTVGRGVTAPAVRVTNQAGIPMPGVKVAFSVTGGDSVANALAVTDNAGTASAGVWTLGEIAGAHVATAATAGAASVVFTATAMPGPAAKISLSGGDGQSGFAGSELLVTLRVLVTDAFGNRVGFARVYFAVVSGGGAVSDSVVSDQSGIAAAHWILGPAGGKQVAKAQVDSSVVLFSAIACDSACESGELAFVHEGQIYVTQRLGQTGRQLTTDSSRRESTPAWSPDGLRLAFSRDRTALGQTLNLGNETWIMNADGSGARRRIAGYHSPAWSPDGTQLAVSRGDCMYFCELFLISADGPEDSPITHIASSAADPAWSPDGKRIVYVLLSGDDGYHKLETMDPSGNDRRTIVPLDEGAIFKPAWSPDGRRIAFSKCLQTCNLFVVNADGTGLQQLTVIDGVFGATWSPDGSRIGFTIWPRGSGSDAEQIAFVPAGGGEPFLIVGSGYNPAWRPRPKP